jgi:hypothetical protein
LGFINTSLNYADREFKPLLIFATASEFCAPQEPALEASRTSDRSGCAFLHISPKTGATQSQY